MSQSVKASTDSQHSNLRPDYVSHSLFKRPGFLYD